VVNSSLRTALALTVSRILENNNNPPVSSEAENVLNACYQDYQNQFIFLSPKELLFMQGFIYLLINLFHLLQLSSSFSE